MAEPATGAEMTPTGGDDPVGAVARLYLGNLFYALERCALSLEQDDKPLDAAFYRGIGRALAEAHRTATVTPSNGAAPRAPSGQ